MSSSLTYDAIMALQNSTFHHECFISVINDASIPTISASSTSSSSSSPASQPVIYCNFIFPIGLNATVEIKDMPCNQFTQPASNTTIYNEGEATASLLPTITPQEIMLGTFTHEYCARIDILHDKYGNGLELESVLFNRFSIPITYRYPKKAGESGNGALSASVDGQQQAQLDTKQIIGIACGAIGGSIVTLLIILLLRRYHRYRSKKRTDDETKADVEVTPMPNGLLI